MKITWILSTVYFLIYKCYGYPTGAPPSACVELMPRHPIRGPDGQPTENYYQPQTTKSPYSFTVQPENPKSGDILTVIINGTDDFGGYILRPFDDKDKPVVGEFQEKDGVQTIECDKPKDTATHTSRDDKQELIIQWKSPVDYKGHVVFKGSVLKNYSTFWKVESKHIAIA